MTKDIAKDLAIIVSGGRTRTTFCGDNLSDVVEDCYSEHEPDLRVGFQAKTRKRIRRFGVCHMVIGRLLGQRGIRILVQKYLAGDISDSQAVRKIYQHRDRYHASIQASLIVESYYGWYFAHRPYDYDLEKLKFKPSANFSKKKLPSWIDWTAKEAQQLDALCGELMRTYNYGLEPEWLDKLA